MFSLDFGTWRENLDHTALLEFTFVQDWLADHRPVDGPKPLSCATGCKRTVSKMYKRVTNKSINYKRQTKAATKLITPSRAQGDAVRCYKALVALLNDNSRQRTDNKGYAKYGKAKAIKERRKAGSAVSATQALQPLSCCNRPKK